MLIVLARASETALMEIIVAIKDAMQKIMLIDHNSERTYCLIKLATVHKQFLITCSKKSGE